MLIRYGAGIDSRVRLMGAAASVGLRDAYLRQGQANQPSSGGFNKTSSVPIGYRPPVAFIPALVDGGMAGRIATSSSTLSNLGALAQLAGNILAESIVSAFARAGLQINASAAGVSAVAGEIVASGVLRSNLLIGSSPSAADIADQVWSRSMTPFNEVNTFGYQLKNLTSGGGGGGGGPTAAQIADAVWAYVTRSLTVSPGPTASAIASQVRTELAVELGRIDAMISSRLAAAGYTAPDNAGVAAIKAKTDNLPTNTEAELNSIKTNTNLIPGAL